MISLKMKIEPHFFIHDGRVHFLCMPKENEPKAPKECLWQKGPFSSAGMPAAKGVFYPDNSG
jgi:hypothetical protein